MSISSRTSRSVRILGVASATAALALGVAGNAFACSIKDFSAAASCANGKGVITVTDTDASGKEATVSVYLESNGADAKHVGDKTVTGTKAGAIVTFSEDWAPGAQYRVHINANKGQVNDDISLLMTPSKACATSETTPPASGTPTPSAPATPPSSATPSDTPSASAGTTAPATTGDNSPSPAAGTSNLAETGASSSTPMIAGIAGGLVVIGGAAVFFGMRRRGASKSN
ncbi:LAETG motif-containing sortase-dependent surface protein [Streptomyces sp. NPDC001795]|uniref:LAETG motif-containing sortase-dependent surface protein n=1 Tax=Streptomyces sp. NPDC001795 TaxID=3154525 RepID=UPI0033200C7A